MGLEKKVTEMWTWAPVSSQVGAWFYFSGENDQEMTH